MIRKITEKPSELLAMLPCWVELPAIRSVSRLREWAGERVILQEMLGEYVEIAHHPNGAPYLPGRNEYISISHSGGYVDVQLSSRPLGIDIEQISGRALRLSARFLSPEEREMLESVEGKAREIRAVLFWSAKEAVFKVSSVDLPDFREDIRLTCPDDNFRKLIAQERKTPERRQYRVSCEIHPEYVRTVARPL